MKQIATITSKRQLTIPISIFRKLGLKKGERVVVIQEKNGIKIQSAKSLVEELAGSVPVPRRFRDLPVGRVIELAKEEYFRGKK